jgi:hypothetical protein
VDVEHIRLVDCGVDTDWRPTARTDGFANAHYRSGWFRVAGGKTVRMDRADGTRLVLLPPKGDGAAVLLETRQARGVHARSAPAVEPLLSQLLEIELVAGCILIRACNAEMGIPEIILIRKDG